MRRNEFLASAAGLAVGGCTRPASSAQFYDIEQGGEPFRTAFNRDANKVRIVALVSPT
jgi:hypothetical protein